MEIAQLAAFERVARDGSFSRAAEALNLTQPAVSTRISLLEAELEGALFERRGRQLHLTALGQHFLPYAQRILALHADGLQAAKDFRAGMRGQVKIAAPTPFLLSYLVDTLAAFRRDYPATDVLIRERDKATIYHLLLDGAMTLGLVNGPVFDQRFTILAHFRDPIVPVVGAKHPLARQSNGSISLHDLHQHTVFRVSMFPQMSAFIDDLAEAARPGSGGAVIAVPMVMARRLVLMGQGVTFLPGSYVQQAVKNGDFVRLDLKGMPSLNSEPLLIALRSRQIDPANEHFCALMKTLWRALLVRE